MTIIEIVNKMTDDYEKQTGIKPTIIYMPMPDLHINGIKITNHVSYLASDGTTSLLFDEKEFIK